MVTANMDILPATASTASRNGSAAKSSSAASAEASPPRETKSELGSIASSLASSESNTTPSSDSLARRHQAEIWRYARFLGASEPQAEDITQETFLTVLRKPPSTHEPAAVRAYLRTIARNLFLVLLRKASRQSEFDLDAAEQIWAETHPRDGGHERLSALDDCLAQLEGRAKQAVDLSYRENISRAAIAMKLEMTEDGIKSLLRRTREILRQCIERKLNQ